MTWMPWLICSFSSDSFSNSPKANPARTYGVWSDDGYRAHIVHKVHAEVPQQTDGARQTVQNQPRNQSPTLLMADVIALVTVSQASVNQFFILCHTVGGHSSTMTPPTSSSSLGLLVEVEFESAMLLYTSTTSPLVELSVDDELTRTPAGVEMFKTAGASVGGGCNMVNGTNSAGRLDTSTPVIAAG